MTMKEKNDELRSRMAQVALEAYANAGFDVIQTAGGTWYIPCLDVDGNESWFKLSAIIPKADEAEGTDGYSLGQEYEEKVAAAAERKAKAQAKAEAAAAKKAKKDVAD